MRIGIITHHYIDNYGAFLQAYALRSAVAGLFPQDEVCIVDYINIKHFIINVGGWFRFKRNENLRCWLKKLRVPTMFSRARKREMELSTRCFTASQVNRLDLDCIIVGSDEVWNYKDSKGRAPVKFGKGLSCKKLVAYAPSVGNVTSDDAPPAYVVDGIKKFRSISARDDSTAQLVSAVKGTAPVRVLDPAFLVGFPEAKLRAAAKPYILFYYCERLPKAVRDQIFEYARAHDMAVYGAGECDDQYTDITVDLTPFEWVEMFRNAAFVFTGTFHGAVFSILNRRPFKVYLTNESRIKKVGSLLRELGITGREIDEDFQFDPAMDPEIDYDSVFEVIEEKRKQSLDYLYEAII